MTTPTVLVIGSANTDMIIKVDHLPKAGETVLGGEFATVSGGKGANQAVGAARAGGSVTFVGRVGRDVFGQKAIDGFKLDGINVDHIISDPAAPSGVALIFIGKDGENSIAVASGANGNLSPEDLRKIRHVFDGVSVVVLQLEVPMNTVQAAAELATEAGARVILNPAPACELPADLLKRTYLITPNQSEAELLTGIVVTDQNSAARAAEELLGRGVANVIVTMGSRGAFVASQQQRTWIPAYKVHAVDTTAAGDVFNGALATAMAEGQDLVDAATFASAAAAISVTRLGAQPSVPYRTEIEEMVVKGKARPPVLC